MNEAMTFRLTAAGSLAAALMLLMPAGAYARQDVSGDGESLREDVQETIEIYMIAKMKRFLKLTDEQERKVVPLVEELNSSRREMNRQRRLILMRLRPVLEDESATDQEISKLIDQLEEMDQRLRDQEVKARAEIRATLAPRQQARFIVFQERFRREIEDRLRRIHQGGAAGPRAPGGGPGRNFPPPGRQRPRR